MSFTTNRKDEVKIPVAPGVACPATWTPSQETITIEARYIVRVPASIGGHTLRVSSRFVNAVWPSSADKSEAVASGKLVSRASTVSTRHFCSLLP